jgi:hypothetical protein
MRGQKGGTIMDAFQMIAERRIAEAMEQGEFDHLKGAGKPLAKDEDPTVPIELHMAYKILKNGGYLPPEMQLRKEINNLADLLSTLEEGTERQTRLRRLRFLLEKFGNIRRLPADMEARYFNEILERINLRGQNNE